MRSNKKLIHKIKVLILIAFGMYLILLRPSQVKREKTVKPEFQSLVVYLKEQGFSEDTIKAIFSDPRVEFYEQVIYQNLSREVLSPVSHPYRDRVPVYEIEDFMKEYRSYLDLAEKKYGVDRETIVAVLFTETKLGRILGRYPVFNVLSSLAVAGNEENLRRIENYVHIKYHYLDYDSRIGVIKRLQERAKKKSKWAKNELASLIRLHLTTNIDALSLVGSYAGAFGLPQFMPSSFLKFGVDGDKDGEIDLFSFPDAIMSVANFLSRAGWGNHYLSQRRALLRYNYSRVYVSKVLNLASLLR